MLLILCYFSSAYRIQNSSSILKLFKEYMIFDSKHNKIVLPFLIYFYYDEISQYHVQTHHVLKRIDEIINIK